MRPPISSNDSGEIDVDLVARMAAGSPLSIRGAGRYRNWLTRKLAASLQNGP
jgi:hypothetical protein